MSPRQRVTSTRSPANPRSAGSRVSDATTVVATTSAAEMARPETNETPMTSIPRNEITTVAPAKVTARPAVSIAMAIDSWTV